jgi:hypothetical protein
MSVTRFRHFRLARAWRAIAGTAELRVVLADLLREGRVFNSGFPADANPVTMAYLQGKRDLALRCFKLTTMTPEQGCALDGEPSGYAPRDFQDGARGQGGRFYDTAS